MFFLNTIFLCYLGPKIHKYDFPLNFNSALYLLHIIPTPSYKLARSLLPLLSPQLLLNDYTVDSTHSFVSSLKNISNADKLFMSSFDIENLFINIPVSETINIIVHLLFIDNNSNIIGLTKKSFETFKYNGFKFFFTFLILYCTRLPVTRWVKLSLNFEFLVPK